MKQMVSFTVCVCVCGTVNYREKKNLPTKGRGGPQGSETSRLPHFQHNRLTDGGEVVSLRRRPGALNPQEDSWYSFLLRG
jgi:hypothetical protein